MMRFLIWGGILALFLPALFLPGLCLAQEPLSVQRHGLQIVALIPESEKIDGVNTTPADRALDILSSALDRLFAISPLTVRRLAALKSKGDVVVLYDARVPKSTFDRVNLAMFLPDFYRPEEDKRTFLVVVGRTGIQWEEEEIAAALAHEIAGHGFQHMQGRLLKMRLLDAECEAYLIQEQVRQDLGVDKASHDSVGLRNELEHHWCDDFRRHTLTQKTSASGEWATRDPDVPALLRDFAAYVKAQ